MTDEEKAARRQSLAFNTEAVRSGLFAAAMDIGEVMKEAGVAEGEASLITGAVEFAVQLWDQTMLAAGNTPKASREAFNRQAQYFFTKHRRMEKQEITKQ